MKPHITLKLCSPRQGPLLPYWVDAITQSNLRSERILPSIDHVFAWHKLPFFATQEYAPAGSAWSPTEIASGLNRVYRLVLQSDTAIPASLIASIRDLPEVERADVGMIGNMDLQPAFPHTLAIRTDSQSRDAIGLDEAHAFSEGEKSIIIAVLDTGVDLNHPEYADSLIQGYDFVDIIDGAQDFIGDRLGADPTPEDEVGHGTHITGIVAASGERMPRGIAPKCSLLPVRVLAAMTKDGHTVGAGLVENINNGVKWAVDKGADVINMSLGVRHMGGGLPHKDVIEYAGLNGVTVVAASGNDGSMDLYYPGAFPSVIAVGAADVNGEVAQFSSYGEHVSFIAPGVDIYSSSLAGGYAFSSGTSHAAPFVTGTVALLMSFAGARGHKLTDNQVKHVLKQTSDKVDQCFKNQRAGFGRLNAADALRYLDYKLNSTRRSSHVSQEENEKAWQGSRQSKRERSRVQESYPRIEE